jgi:NAD(P)-dependent dehydrogenase (short-subunit alcohol dehydrogenase family)
VADVPLGQFGAPDNIAAAVSYLASDAAQFITGERISGSGPHFVMDAIPVRLTGRRPRPGGPRERLAHVGRALILGRWLRSRKSFSVDAEKGRSPINGMLAR